MVFAWLVAEALAIDEAEARRALWDALLAEAERGELPAAIAQYQLISRNLPGGSPTHAEALYWLGHGLYELGRVDDARTALLDGIRTGLCLQCRELLEEIELEQHSVLEVPSAWTFDGEHGLFHPFDVQDRGAIRVTEVGAGRALEWSTLVRERQPDRLVLGVRTPKARQLRFLVRSDALDAVIEVHAEDLRGRAYTSPPIEVPRGPVRRVSVMLDTLVAAEGGRALRPAEVARLELVDRTGARVTGANTLWIDDLELR